MKHPNALILSKIYGYYVESNYQAMLDLCADDFTFQLAGKSLLAGKFNKETFLNQYIPKQKELSGGTYQFDVHDIMASDQHGVVMGSIKATTFGKPVELRVVHVWRMGDGKPVACYEYPRDLYQLDAVWG